MNPHQLKRLFPNASKSVLAANRGDYGPGEPEAHHSVPHPQPEPHQAAALERADAGKEAGLCRSFERVTVRFTGFRVRPLDPDNFAASVKDLLDGCRHAGLLYGDEPWWIKLETEQQKVRSYKEEKTELEIIWPQPPLP